MPKGAYRDWLGVFRFAMSLAFEGISRQSRFC